MPAVRKLFVIVMLLVGVAFQGWAAAAQRAMPAHGTSDPAHAALHLQEVAHHHHDDAADGADAVVVDSSAESSSHLASDGALSSPAAGPVVSAAVSKAAPYATPGWRQDPLSSPDPQGLRKPPRLNS